MEKTSNFFGEPEPPKRRRGQQVERVTPAPPSRLISTGDLMLAMMQATSDPACQPEKINALLDARDRLMREQARVAFTSAFIAMQAELPVIDATGRIEIEAKQAGRKRQSTPYATYNEINRVTKPILSKHGFSIIFRPDVGPGGVGILMRAELSYVCKTGYGDFVHSEYCVIPAPLETSGSKNNVQGVGSSLAYTKRYCIVNLLNLVSHAPEDRDDDGKSAGPIAGQISNVPVITAQQAIELTQQIKNCGVGLEKFCAHYSLEKVDELPAHQYEEAIAACANYAAARNRPGGQAQIAS